MSNNIYILKQYDMDLLKFYMKNTDDGLDVEIIEVNKEKLCLLPLSMEQTNIGLKK